VDLDQPPYTIARDITTGDGDRVRIDVGREHAPAQQFCGGDRENAGTSSDIEWPAKSASLRQEFESHQASSGRWMLTGAKGCRRIHCDRDRAGWFGTAVMRAIDKEPADPQRGKRELIFSEPIPRRQLLFTNIQESASSGGSCERNLNSEFRVQ